MTTSVKSRVWRILRHLRNFEYLEERAGRGVAQIPGVLLQAGEVVLGVYRNHPGSLQDAVVVTDRGLWIDRPGPWDFISFRDVESVELVERKEDAENLSLRLSGGRSAILAVRGGTDRTRDALEFLRFLDRVSR